MTPPAGYVDLPSVCSERNRANAIIDEVLRRLMWRVKGRRGMTAEEVREIHAMIVERRRA